MSPSAQPPLFRTAAVLGAGVMGSQVAALLAGAGLTVDLLDLPGEGDDSNGPARRGLAAATKMNPPPFFTSEAAARVVPGNFRDDLERAARADWIVEAVVERLDVKQALFTRLEPLLRKDAVVSTNTSGLPIARVAEGRSEDFRRRFLGTHFFNPPRYLRLLELIALPDTDPSVLEAVRAFARLHLGKGVVQAKDTPNFIANRIGIFAALGAVRHVTEGGYTLEEVDELTGRLIGRPKSATFRTADLVGLDTLVHVANNLLENLAHDESREAFRPPWLLLKLVERGSYGAKSGGGFYKKVEGKILALDPATMKYAAPGSKKLGDLDDLAKVKPLAERLRRLFADGGRAGEFFRATTLELLSYSARCVPEIADEVVDVDTAMRLGFGWELGPFETWEALGFRPLLEELRKRRLRLPAWIDDLERQGAEGFYRRAPRRLASWAPGRGFAERALPADEIDLAEVAADPARVLWSDDEAALLDLGEGVLLFEFRSKMNAIGRQVIDGLRRAIETAEDGPWHGLVIGNGAEHFSVGANLAELGSAVMHGRWDEVEGAVASFQQAAQRVRYAAKPVVLATQGRVLGGACELLMACSHPVCAVESYIGLVEIGAGLIPAGGGTMRMAAYAAERAASDAPEHVAPHLRVAFETLAMARVAGSAPQAVQLGLAPARTVVVPHAERRLWVARSQVLRLAEQGYGPPPVRSAIRVLGEPGRASFDVGIQHLVAGGFVDPYDAQVARRLAWVLTGGDLPVAHHLHEQQLLDLEREVFLSLLGNTRTQQKIAELLTRNQPKAAQMAAKGLVTLTSVLRRKRAPAK